MAAPRDPDSEAIRAWMPVVRRIAAARRRSLPANVTQDDLEAAGMTAVWDAIKEHDGQIPLDAHVRQKVGWAINDWLRKVSHVDRRSTQEVAFVGEEHLDQVSAGEDPLEIIEREQAARQRIQAMTPTQRAVAGQVLGGEEIKGIAAGMGISASRVSQHCNEAVARMGRSRQRTPDTFDPALVQIRMGEPVPPPLGARVNRYSALLARIPATGHVVLGITPARNLVSQAKREGVRYMYRQLNDTTAGFWREPSPEQTKEFKRGKK